MQLPQDCSKLATTLAVQADVADKSADLAGKNKTTLLPLAAQFPMIARACNLGQMATTWFAKVTGLEEDRLEMMAAEKRFKHVKGLVAGIESIPTVVNAHAMAACELAAFFPVLAEALEALAEDIKLGQDEGWLDKPNPDETTSAKQRKVYESASWFWALHARLADLQYASEDKRIEAAELTTVSKSMLGKALEIANTIPEPPEASESNQQVLQVQQQMRAAKTLLVSTITTIAGLIDNEVTHESGANAP